MKDDKRDKWRRFLPDLTFNRRTIKKRMNKIEGVTVRHAHKFVIKRWSNVRDVQFHVILWIVAMGALIAATGLQLMWNQQSYQTTAAVNTGTYAEAALGPIDTLNPLFASSSAEQSISYLLFSRMLNYDTTGHLNYDLATNVAVNDAKTVYTIKIRPDAKWSDGYKLTADDIVFTVDLMKDSNTRSTVSGWGNISAKAINSTTVEFTLQSTYAAFENALNFAILPKHIFSDVPHANIRENSFSQNPITSGPFKFGFIQNVDTTSGKKIIYMVRNNDHYGGTAKLARFQLHAYDTTDQIINALSINEVNAATDLLPADISRVDSKRYDVVYKPIQSGVYALLNTKSTLMGDVSVRRALQAATDTAAVRSKLPSNTPELYLPFTDGQLTGDVPAVPQFSLKNAKNILDSAGWKLNSDGIRVKDGVKLTLSVVAIKNSEYESVLEVLAGQWRALGVEIDTKIVDPYDTTQDVTQNILQPRNYDVLLYQLNIGADPDVYPYWHSSQASPQGYNFSNYSNIISDEALSSALARTEPAIRNAKYITFAKQWLSDAPAIGLYQSTTQYVKSKSVQSFNNSNIFISSVDRYNDILNWSVGTKSVYKTP